MTTQTTLEDIIRGLAARGEISNISLSMNGSHTKWRASFVPCTVFGQSFAEDADPIKALMTALTTVKLKSRKAPTDRELAAAEALSTAKVEQETVAADGVDPEIDALM